MPAVGTCMGCHSLIDVTNPVIGKNPEIKKLEKYWADKQPIPWIRIHKVPEYVHFPHMRHVNAGVTCQTCHGQIQEDVPGLSVLLAEHGMVRELPRERLRPIRR